MPTRAARDAARLLIAILLVSVACAGCGPKPTATVTGFYDALQKGDFGKASSFMQTPGEVGAMDSNPPENVEMLRKLLARITYSVNPEAAVDGSAATVEASVTGPGRWPGPAGRAFHSVAAFGPAFGHSKARGAEDTNRLGTYQAL